jgi:hypothetical protein
MTHKDWRYRALKQQLSASEHELLAAAAKLGELAEFQPNAGGGN